MILKQFFKNKQKRKRIAHILAGIVILIHAYEKYEGGHDTYIPFAIAGLVFLSIALFHPLIERKAPWIDGVFFAIEGILSLIVAFDFFHLGKKALPIAYLLLGIFQFFISFRKSKKGLVQHKLNH
ncbi:MAG: hypothetical protein WKF91_13655 [Segetibacter sp.]|jgi:hypothetical protein